MLNAHLVAWLSSVATMVLSVGIASGQDYPNKPIRIFTSPIGGGSDFDARLIAQGISGSLRQPVVVENRPSLIGIETVSKAAADGYTLLLGGGGIMFAALLRKMSFDPVRDLAPISITAKAPNILVVHPSVPAKSVKELIALAKARPGELNYGMSGIGGAGHLSMELFKSMAGVNIASVNYKGSSLGLNALMGGEVQVMLADVSVVPPLAKSGKLRALAVTSPEPSDLFPGLPTVAASGVPGYDWVGIDAIWAPAGTPVAIINRLNQEIVRVLRTPEAKAQLLSIGVEVVGSSPEQLAATVKSETTRVGKVIKEAGIKLE